MERLEPTVHARAFTFPPWFLLDGVMTMDEVYLEFVAHVSGCLVGFPILSPHKYRLTTTAFVQILDSKVLTFTAQYFFFLGLHPT